MLLNNGNHQKVQNRCMTFNLKIVKYIEKTKRFNLYFVLT